MLILNPISEKLIAFVIWIASGVYKVAAFVFQIFLVLCANELVDSDTYDTMINNFYAVLGVIVLFFLAFSFLKAMVNPDDDKLGTSAVKQIIINLVTSVIIMALVPTVFGFLYDMQHAVLVEQNTIGKFFNYGGLDSQAASENSSSLVQRGAYQIVNGVFTAFFNADQDWCRLNSSYDVKSCQGLITTNIDGLGETKLSKAMSDVDSGGKFGLYKEFADNVDDGEIDFQWLLSLAGGIALIYVGVSYCFDMALRMIKLVFYQLIAPIPIFARVVPDTKLSGSFEQWIKITLACYFEVYVRIFAMYFVIFLCTTMLKDGNFLSERIYEYGWFVGLFGKAFVLMGIVMFMRQAPKLISDVTGIDTGNMSLGIKNKLKEGGFFAAGSIAGAGVTALARNGVNAYKNVSESWRNTRANWQKGKFKENARLAFGSTRATLAGLGSTIAGGASGAVRGGRAGWGAGGFNEMASAAGTGARGAVEARERRAMYRARHDGTIRGVARGRREDAWDSFKRWAGINNIQELQEERSSIQKVTSSMDAVTDATKNMLRNEINGKGKGWSFGIDATTAAGQAEIVDSRYGGKFQYGFTADNYRELSDALDRAKTSGEEVDFRGKKYTADQLQRMFGKYESDFSKALANQLLTSDADYSAIKAKLRLKYTDASTGIVDEAKLLDEIALMDSQRGVAESFKHELERAIGSGVLDIANSQAQQIHLAGGSNDGSQITRTNVNGSIKINDGAVDRISAAAKQRTGEIESEISKIQQKEADKNGK